MSDSLERLPEYQCHKVVRAAKILSISVDSDGGVLSLDAPGLGAVAVDAAYMIKHNPQVGGYFVVYRDGYQSWSPASEFEDGYTLVDGSTQ